MHSARRLSARRQHAKLTLYRRFSHVLLASVPRRPTAPASRQSVGRAHALEDGTPTPHATATTPHTIATHHRHTPPRQPRSARVPPPAAVAAPTAPSAIPWPQALLSAAMITWQLGALAGDPLDESWATLWVFDAFWHALYFAVLLAVCYLWSPTKSNLQYAYMDELGQEEMQNATELDDF